MQILWFIDKDCDDKLGMEDANEWEQYRKNLTLLEESNIFTNRRKA